MGITTGSVVSWQLPTRIDTVVLSAALARLGAVQNPIIHLYREREVGFALRQTGAALFVVPGTWRDIDFGAMADQSAAELEPRPPTILSLRGGPSRGRPRRPASASPGTDPSDDPIRWIYYTSGTTSDPKGVRHTDTDAHRRRPGPRHGARHEPRTTSARSPFPSPTSPGPTTSS